MLGIILLLIMLQDFLPEAHPTIPTLGAYDILHPTYDYLIFFFNTRIIVAFRGCKNLSFVILSAFDNCLLNQAPFNIADLSYTKR